MTTSPKVSVIIAAFEAEAFLDRAIASARAQTLGDIEIIVVDDASKDGTAAVAYRHAAADDRVIVVELAHNGGPGVARNAGLDRAHGEWIAMLDADDAFTPERLARLTVRAEVEHVQMIADDLTVEEAGAPPKRLLEASWHGRDSLRLDASAFIAGNRGAREQGRVLYGFLKPLIRRDLLQAHGVRYRPLRLAEDYFLYLEALLLGAAWIVVRESFYLYAVRPGSLTGSFTPQVLDAMAEADRRLLEERGAGIGAAEVRAIRGHRRDVLGAAAWTRLVEGLRARDPRALGRVLRTPVAGWGVLLAKFGDAVRRAVGAKALAP